MTVDHWGQRRLLTVSGLAAAALALAACSSTSSSDASSSSAPSAAAASSAAVSSEPAASAEGSAAADDVVAQATQRVEGWYAANDAPVNTADVLPNNLEGKKIFYLSAGLSSPSGTAGVNALNAVQKDLGFEYTAFDGEFTPSKYQEGMRQAIAQNYDVVIVYGVDCPGNEAPLKELKDAGIPVIGLASVDCNEGGRDGEPLFAAGVTYPLAEGKTGQAYDQWYEYGQSQADYLIAKLNGDVRVIQFDVPDFAVTAGLGQGFRDQLATCSTCQLLETVNVGVADFGPNLAQKADQALLKHPDANAVAINYDDLVTLGIANSVVQSGRNDELLVVAGEGLPAVADIVRENKGTDAGWAYSYDWDHYAAVATAMSALAGQDAPVAGQPTIWYDAETNMPASGGWVPGVDFVAAFNQAWGS